MVSTWTWVLVFFGSIVVGGAAMKAHLFIDRHVFGKYEFFLVVPSLATAVVAGMSPIPCLISIGGIIYNIVHALAR